MARKCSGQYGILGDFSLVSLMRIVSGLAVGCRNTGYEKSAIRSRVCLQAYRKPERGCGSQPPLGSMLKSEVWRQHESRKAASFLLPVSHAAYHRVTPPKAFAPPSIYRALALAFLWLFYS